MTDKNKEMSDEDLKKFLDAEEKEAVGYAWGDLSAQREKEMKYYLAEPFGNEVEERSQVVDTSVSDSIEWILPDLIRIFASTDKAVEFEAQSVEDEKGAKQSTATCNYVFWRQNPGFLILYTWFKDALIQKNGAVKWWWEKKVSKKTEKYDGVSVEELTMMLDKDPDNIEIVSKSEPYPDEAGHEMAMQAWQAMAQHAQQSGQEPPPQPEPQQLIDVEVEISDETGKTCIAPIPPEELLVSRRHNSILLDDCPYVAHLCKRTLSQLRDMGYEFDDADVVGDAPAWIDNAPEKIVRDSYNENPGSQPLRVDSADPSQQEVWLREAYVLVDQDGDGIAERRRIVRAGNKIFENDPCDDVQIAAITPIIMTHKFYGMSVAELVMDLQLLKSTLWRQMIDNLFAANNQGHIVLASADGRVQANIDDLLTSRPNRVIREYQPNAVRPEVTPWIAGQTFPMLEYIDQQRMNRTGSNSLSSGLDADAINKTARGATMADNKMQAKIELIARIFAETGVKAMFRGILHMLSKYQTKPMTYRLLNEYTQVDPREWKTSYDMTVNVGIGTGNKDQQLMHLTTIAASQAQAVQAGGMGLLVTPKNIYNVQARIAENAGFKNVQEFWTDPGENMPQPPEPKPDPVLMRDLDIKEFIAKTNRTQGEARLKLDRDKADAEIRLKGGIALQDGEQWSADRSVTAATSLAGIEQRQAEHAHVVHQAAHEAATQAVAIGKEESDDTPSQERQLLAAVIQTQMHMAEQLQALMAEVGKEKPRMRRVPTRDPKTNRILHVDEVPIT